MDILNELREIQKKVNLTGRCFSFNLTIENSEISITITITFGWDFVFDEAKIFNACDFETNYAGLKKYITIDGFKDFIV